MDNYNNLITEYKFQKDVISKMEKQGWKELTYFERNSETQVVIKDVLDKKILFDLNININTNTKNLSYIYELISSLEKQNDALIIIKNKLIYKLIK